MGNSNNKFEVPEAPEPPPLPGSEEDLRVLKEGVKYLHFPGSSEYKSARCDKTWLKDPSSFLKPSAIVSAQTPEEVLVAVKFAIATGVKIQAACGRHTHECMVEGSLCVDLSSYMNEVTVNKETREVRVGGGATIGAVDAACAPHFLMVPVGRAHTTGCAGQMIYTGGHGYNERMYGLGVDYLHSATVVTTRNGGEIITCSAQEETDLFWAIKGGGPNFGIVCEMTFVATVLPNEGKFAAGQRVYLPTGFFGMPTRKSVLHHAVERFDVNKPREYGSSVTVLGGGKMKPCIMAEFWFGDNTQAGLDYFASTKQNVGFAVADTYGIHDYYTGIQRWANGPKGEDVGPGAYYYRGIMPKRFTKEMADVIAATLDKPAPDGFQPVVILDIMGGGKSQDPEAAAASALPNRPNYWIIILANWMPEVIGPKGRELAVDYVKTLWKELFTLSLAAEDEGNKHLLDSHINSQELLDDTLQMGQQAKVSQVYGDSTDRLKTIKSVYDPCGLFGTALK